MIVAFEDRRVPWVLIQFCAIVTRKRSIIHNLSANTSTAKWFSFLIVILVQCMLSISSVYFWNLVTHVSVPSEYTVKGNGYPTLILTQEIVWNSRHASVTNTQSLLDWEPREGQLYREPGARQTTEERSRVGDGGSSWGSESSVVRDRQHMYLLWGVPRMSCARPSLLTGFLSRSEFQFLAGVTYPEWCAIAAAEEINVKVSCASSPRLVLVCQR